MHKLRELKANIIRSILLSSVDYTPFNPTNQCNTGTSPFWWLLFRLEMLILTPTTKNQRDEKTIRVAILERMGRLFRGNIVSLYKEAMDFSNWIAPTDRPDRPSNRVVQIAADAGNYRSAAAWVCSDTKIASIGPSNIESVHCMYIQQVPSLGFPPPQKNSLASSIARRYMQEYPLWSRA